MVNFRTFDLNLLRVLDALLREGSTVRAGARLGMSQSAVSSALARLRSALGDELFFRHRGGLAPTRFAETLRDPLREALDGLQGILSGPGGFDPAASDARFRISGSDFFAEMLMPPLAEALSREAPLMRVHLVDLVPDSYVATLERYGADMALVPALELPNWVHSRHVFDSAFAVIARAGHPAVAAAAVRPGEVMPVDLFCDLYHVLFSPEGKTRAMGDAALARVGRERRVAMTLPVFSGVCRAVAGSDLIALIPRQLARRVAGPMGLEVYAPPMPIAPAPIVMIWHRRHDAWPAHGWMRDRIAALLAPLDADPDF
ncbi:LysR family transcriptional regulator [Limimaricola pyoseonensis]|uniref:LysR family transcriptional regulator n=1 Tax=Limimaricola pyoseonensis TaxID=521013 RepID=UPI000B7F249C|nr:LysR family transcriptional regulator [Limimaricola pyoseonensis]